MSASCFLRSSGVNLRTSSESAQIELPHRINAGARRSGGARVWTGTHQTLGRGAFSNRATRRLPRRCFWDTARPETPPGARPAAGRPTAGLVPVGVSSHRLVRAEYKAPHAPEDVHVKKTWKDYGWRDPHWEKFGGASAWSVETETFHTYKHPSEIIQHELIESLLESTKDAAKDHARVREILHNARERAFLKDWQPITGGGEYVQGLSYEEMATLLNTDPEDESLMQEIFDTAFAIKERIYGNRIVLFAPLYLANHCMNDCQYCAFRVKNKGIERVSMTHDEIRREVEALERMGHRRLLVLTGESPKYTFDTFLGALKVIKDVTTEPCGSIRRMNVEIPALSVSDMKRLKSLDCVGTFTLFQETYHRPTFEQMHLAGPKSDYDHRVLTMDRAFRGGIDDVGVGVLFGLHDYRFECMALLMHANHLLEEYKAGPHTISVPRMRPADGSEVSVGPPAPVDDEHFRKMVAILRVAVPYTGMILSTRESPDMRRHLLRVGMSQMSAGSHTDVGSYHREGANEQTNADLGGDKMKGQFTLMDHRPVNEIVADLMQEGYVPSWCTACYRKGRTGEDFMKIARAGEIHNFCHPNSLLTLQEYLKDYGTEEERELGQQLIEKESKVNLSEKAQKKLQAGLERIRRGEHDVYM